MKFAYYIQNHLWKCFSFIMRIKKSIRFSWTIFLYKYVFYEFSIVIFLFPHIHSNRKIKIASKSFAANYIEEDKIFIFITKNASSFK